MEKNSIIKYLNNILSSLKEGKNKGLVFQDVIKKIADTINSISNDETNIVLFGSFSDGKTSVVAGWLEEELDNMKIDTDESSDEIIIYQPDNLNARIIDTPGLFGDKKKGADKLSETTIKYISEAHLIIYVVDATNPMKESHKSIIKWLLKDLNKLGETIFVINKMDTVSDLDDKTDFDRNSKIKTDTLSKSIGNLLSLTSQEKEQLRITCVSANPYNEGINSWLEDLEEYRSLSHLSPLKSFITEITENNSSDLQTKTALSVVRDICISKTNILTQDIASYEDKLAKRSVQVKIMEEDIQFIKKDAGNTLRNIKNELHALRDSVSREISSSSKSTFYNVLDRNLGIKGKGNNQEIGFYLIDKIQTIVDDGVENLQGETSKIVNNIDESIKDLDTTMQDFITGGLGKALKGVKAIPVKELSQGVLKVRNLLKLSVKFKPWGAIKFAKNIGLAAAGVGALLGIVMALWDKKKLAEFEDSKEEMNGSISTMFSEILSGLGSTDDFIDNYIKGYGDLKKAIEHLKSQNDEITLVIDNSKEWKLKLEDYLNNSNIEDVEFEEVEDLNIN